MFKQIKGLISIIGGVITAFGLTLFVHGQGRKKGQQETIKALNKAEEQRRETQATIDKRQQQAINEALGVTNDNAVDRFNQLFEHASDPPKS